MTDEQTKQVQIFAELCLEESTKHRDGLKFEETLQAISRLKESLKIAFETAVEGDAQ